MLEVFDCGLLPYQEAWALQQKWHSERVQNLIPDRVLLCEHPPVYTLGRQFRGEDVDCQGIPVFRVERGGDISFHEPGQLVLYPIFALEAERRDIGAFLRGLEQIVIDSLITWSVRAERDVRNTGVWVNGHKLASIGIAVKRWVTWHGLSLNVHNSLALAQSIRPCGLDPTLLTTLEQVLIPAPTMGEVKTELLRHLQAWWSR